MRNWQGWIFFFAILIFWFYGLDIKPIHHDESVNLWWLTQITELGYFPYDPTNFHGPLFFYIQWIFQRLFGDELWVLRSVGVLFSLSSVWLLWKRNYKAAALVFALSPALLFFSRSGIHEPLFVFFQLLLFLGILDFAEKKEHAFDWIILGFVGSIATKETWAISFVALIPTLFTLGIRNFKLEKRHAFPIVLGLFVTSILFSGFLDFFKAFLPWLQTGTETGRHYKPFAYWAELTVKNEPLILIVILLGSGLLFWKKDFADQRKFRAIYIFGFVQFLIYSLIPYKTPWCLISILWPFVLLSDDVLREISWKKIFPFVVIAVGMQSYISYKIVFKNPIDFEHPYVYVQSSQELKEFSDSVNPRTSVIVFLDDAWPFPWVFRHQRHLQFLHEHLPEQQLSDQIGSAEMIVTQAKYRPVVEKYWPKFQVKKFFLREKSQEILIYERSL